MADGSKLSIYSALAGNIAVSVVKFAAFAVGGSSAMLTEAIHSVIDTVNQLLLLYGMHRGDKPPDEDHPFGHGMEVYFWTFVVSLLIFSLGGAVAVYGGVLKLLHPTPIQHAGLSMAVIAVSAVFETVSLAFSMKAAERTRTALARKYYPRLTWFTAIHISKDPGVFEVYAEGGASIVGLAIAALGIGGSAWLGWAPADGLASIAIGLLLAVVAFVLGAETRSLLTGESAAKPVVAEMRAILEADKRVQTVSEVQSMHLGPEQILVAATLDFQDSLTGPELEDATDELTVRLKAADPRITRLYLRPGRDGETKPAAKPAARRKAASRSGAPAPADPRK